MRGLSLAVAAMALCACAPLVMAEPLMLGPFVGTLPCADCPDVATVLILTRKGQGWAEGSYRLEETTAEGPIVSVGDWTTLRGDAVDEDAVVYQLDPDRPQTSRYFKKLDARSIRLLDAHLKALPDGTPATLRIAP